MQQFALNILVVCGFGLVLAACGGGGGSRAPAASPPATPPANLKGWFVDTRVEGLAYRTNTVSGMTDATGEFEYAAGEEVTFTLGAVELGRAPGSRWLTPLDLVVGGTSSTVEVLNIVRLLMLVDEDGSMENGIQISAAMHTAAEEWLDVDLASSDFDSVLVPILNSVESVLGRSVEIPIVADAQSHLQASLACLASGVFAGRFEGDDEGTFLLWVQSERFDPPNFGDNMARAGVTSALAYSEVDDFVIGVRPRQGLMFDQVRSFISGTTTTGSHFTGILSDYDQIEDGTWGNDEFDESGTFSGSRLAGAPEARYRLVGFFSVGANFTPDHTGLVALDVLANDVVSGVARNLRGSEQSQLAGELSDGVISVQAGDASWTLQFDATGEDPTNDLFLGETAGFLGRVEGGGFDGADVIGTSCRL